MASSSPPTPGRLCGLTEWHRRRRQGLKDCLVPSPKCGDGFLGSPPLASPGEEVFPDCSQPSPPPCDAFPDDSPAFGTGFPAGLESFSPVTCASPADFPRNDLVKRNTRFVKWEYEFGRILGEGSFGQVHKAKHRRTGTARAIKELPKSGTETDEFEWELQALVALDHPHIVKVVEWFDDEDNYYLVMELCTGPDLFKYILNVIEDTNGVGFVTEREISVILRQCLKAVLCCHANGFIHRDLNAKNFMLTGSDQTVKLIDFGLAKRFLGFMPTEKFIEVVGTSHYMSPEMLLNGEYSPAGDIWSLGVLLYVMLTGTMLLPKDDDRKRTLLKKKGYVRRKLDTCKVLQRRNTSPQVRSVLEDMLQHDPLRRIPAADALMHPFILSFCNDFLGPHDLDFDFDIMAKLRRFAKAPRLMKVALIMMTHLQDHDRGLVRVKHMFRTLDSDGDGEISLADLALGLSVHGIEAPLDLDQIFAACDCNQSGRLTFQEFVSSQLPPDLIDERLCHEAFNVLDADSKGQLTARELQNVCRSYPLEKCEQMVSQADPTGKGYFDFDDFHRFLRGDDAVDAEPPRKLARYDSLGGVSATSAPPEGLMPSPPSRSPPPDSSPPSCGELESPREAEIEAPAAEVDEGALE